MRQTARNIFISACSLAVLVGAFMLTAAPSAIAASAVEQGKAVAFNRKKGNCLACHAMDDGTLPGNIGPPLISMKLRFPDKAVLRAQIWDATVNNPNSIMIPFGRNGVLSEAEIDQIVEYVYTL
jgi:sulfur-oxidizing protein SoxX